MLSKHLLVPVCALFLLMLVVSTTAQTILLPGHPVAPNTTPTLPPGVDPSWGWETFLDESFDGADTLHPSWDIHGGLLDFGQDGAATYGVMGQGHATTAEAGSHSWKNYALTVRFRFVGTNPLEFNIITHIGFPQGFLGPPLQSVPDPMPRIHYRIQVAPGSSGLPEATAMAVRDDQPQAPAIYIPTTPFPLIAGQWHEITVLRKDELFQLYVDSNKEASQDMSAYPAAGPGIFRIEHVSGADLQIDRVEVVGEKPQRVWQFLAAPTGGDVKQIWPHPTNPDILTVGVAHSGVWVTHDGGSTWNFMHYGLNSVDLERLYMSPYNPFLLIEAGPGSGSAYYTHDGGERWRNVAFEDADCVGDKPLAFSSRYPDRVYYGAGGAGCICRSDDAGRYFQRPANPTYTCKREIQAITVTYAKEKELIWVSTSEGKLGRSVDGGTSWEFYPDGATPVSEPVQDFYVLTDDPKRIYALTASGVYHTVNDPDAEPLAAVSWTKLTSVPTGGHSLIRTSDDRFHFISGLGVVSFNADGSGVQLTEFPYVGGPDGLTYIAPDSSDPQSLFLGSLIGLYRFDTQTQQLMAIDDQIGGLGVLSLAVDPEYPALVWAGSWLNGLLYSLDHGQTWHRVFRDDRTCRLDECQRDELAGKGYHLLKVDPNNGCNMFAAGDGPGGLVFIASHDRGRTWSKLGPAAGIDSAYITDVAFFPGDPRIIYAAAGCAQRYFGFSQTCDQDPQGLYRSNDGGRSFTRVGAPPGHAQLTSVAVHPNDDQKLWVGTPDAGVWYSADGGQHFTRVGTGTLPDYIVDVAVDPSNPNVLYTGGDTVYQNHWLNRGPGWDEVTSPVYPQRLHKSTDGGQTWVALPLPSMPLEQIVIDPHDPNKIYVGTHSPGVWFSADAGDTWDLLGKGMLYFDKTRSQHNYVFGLTLSPDGGTVYAGSCGRGVFRLGVPTDPPLNNLPACSEAAKWVYLPVVQK